MSKSRVTKSPIRPAAGIKPALQEKSRKRRETHKVLAALEQPPQLRQRNDLAPTIHIEYLPTASLRPATRRVRRSETAQVARIERSVKQFGVCIPVLIDRNRQIIHGHVVWQAAVRLGVEEIPTVKIDHLSKSAQRALAIALNRTAETGSWDIEALKIEFEELIELDEDVISTGFELAEIDALLIEDASAASADDSVPIVPQAPVSRPGDLWLCGEHRITQGDARDPTVYECLFAETPPARLVLTDPPFNVPVLGHCTSQAHHREFAMAHGELTRDEFAAFNREWIRSALPYLIDGGLLATYIDWRSVELILATGRELDLELLNIVVWAKSNAGQGSLWRSQHELLPIFKKGTDPHTNNVGLGRLGRNRSNLWSYAGATTLGSDAREGLSVHPTVKPCAMLEDAILDVTSRGEVVLDCFLGSGSTLIAAETTGRICRAVELDLGYIDAAVERWQRAAGAEAILNETNETFAEVSLRRRSPTSDEEVR